MTSHRDCRNYAPLDVAKGLCHRSKELVPADGEACPEFTLMPKCGNCAQFKPSAERQELGTCLASDQEPKFFTYPDLAAVTCAQHRPR